MRLLLACFYLGTQTGLAAMGQANLWDERRHQNPQLAALNLPGLPSSTLFSAAAATTSKKSTALLPDNAPGSFDEWLKRIPAPTGTLKRVDSRASQSGLRAGVLLIQDVHRNAEAQENEHAALTALLSERVGAVALEGAFGALRWDGWNRLPAGDHVNAALTYWRGRGDLTGAMAALLAAPTHPLAIGADDSRLYNENRDAYLEASKTQPAALSELKFRRSRIAVEKQTTFNSHLLEFDVAVQRYRRSEEPLGAYVRALESQGRRLSALIAPSDNFVRFTQALSLEARLDVKRVEEERGRFLTQLLHQLAPAQLRQLELKSQAYRNGDIDHAAFYGYLSNVAAEANIQIRLFPRLDSYIHYVSLASAVKAEPLFNELAAREQSIYAGLASTAAERRLVQQDRQLYLTERLVSFQLTNSEWRELKPQSGEWRSFENFYRSADQRSHAMVEKLLHQMKSSTGQPLVLVVGGFHVAEIVQALTDRDVSVAVWTPRLSHVDATEGSAYLSLFCQRQTPLELWLDAPRLTLSPPVWPRSLETAVTATAAMGWLRAQLRSAVLNSAKLRSPEKLQTLSAILGSPVRDVRVDGAQVQVDMQEPPINLAADFEDDGAVKSFASHERTTGRLRRALSPVGELRRTLSFSLPWSRLEKLIDFVRAHDPLSSDPAAQAKRLAGATGLREITQTAFAIGAFASLGGVLIIAITSHATAVTMVLATAVAWLPGLTHLFVHYAHNWLFPEARLTLEPVRFEGRMWLPSDEVALTMSVVRSSSDRERARFRQLYPAYLADIRAFVAEAAQVAEGGARIDTSILQQSQTDYQGAAELVANAIDAMVRRRGGDSIGRFGNGFQSARAVLALFPSKESRLDVTTRVENGLVRHLRFRYDSAKKRRQFQINWETDADSARRVGTTVEVVLAGEPEKVSAYLNEMEQYLRSTFAHSRSVNIDLIRDGKRATINAPSSQWRDRDGAATDRLKYPDASITIEITDNGYRIADAGEGIDDATLLERLTVPKSKNDDNVQTGHEFDFRYEPQSEEASSDRCEITVMKGGRAVIQRVVHGPGLPRAFVFDLPGVARITESWSGFDFGPNESDNIPQVEAITRAMMESRAPMAEKIQVLNAWGELLSSEYAPASGLQTAKATLAPWLRMLRQNGTAVLPLAPGFLALDLKGTPAVFVHEHLLSDFVPENVPGSQLVLEVGNERARFSVEHPTKLMYRVDFRDETPQFEFGGAVYMARAASERHDGMPANTDLVAAPQTSYEDAERVRARTRSGTEHFFFPMAGKLSEAAQAALASLVDRFEFMSVLAAALQQNIRDFLLKAKTSLGESWLARVQLVWNHVGPHVPAAWLPDLVRVAMRGRVSEKTHAPRGLTPVVSGNNFVGSAELLTITKLVRFNDDLLALRQEKIYRIQANGLPDSTPYVDIGDVLDMQDVSGRLFITAQKGPDKKFTLFCKSGEQSPVPLLREISNAKYDHRLYVRGNRVLLRSELIRGKVVFWDESMPKPGLRKIPNGTGILNGTNDALFVTDGDAVHHLDLETFHQLEHFAEGDELITHAGFLHDIKTAGPQLVTAFLSEPKNESIRHLHIGVSGKLVQVDSFGFNEPIRFFNGELWRITSESGRKILLRGRLFSNAIRWEEMDLDGYTDPQQLFVAGQGIFLRATNAHGALEIVQVNPAQLQPITKVGAPITDIASMDIRASAYLDMKSWYFSPASAE